MHFVPCIDAALTRVDKGCRLSIKLADSADSLNTVQSSPKHTKVSHNDMQTHAQRQRINCENYLIVDCQP